VNKKTLTVPQISKPKRSKTKKKMKYMKNNLLLVELFDENDLK
jgi:hypothetical protein